jgi:hypothetical protein
LKSLSVFISVIKFVVKVENKMDEETKNVPSDRELEIVGRVEDPPSKEGRAQRP